MRVLQPSRSPSILGVGAQLLGGLEAVPEVPRAIRELLDRPRYLEAVRRVAADMAALPDVTTTVAVLGGLGS